MKFDRWGRLLALALVVTTSWLCLAPPALAATDVPAEFAGRVVGADGVTPVAGAGVVLLDRVARSEHRSNPTHENGGFALDVPPGTYTILIDTPEGAYLASEGLTLQAGANQPLLLALSAERPTAPPPGLAAEGGWPTWLKWLVVGVVVVAGAVVINEVTEDGDVPATPF